MTKDEAFARLGKSKFRSRGRPLSAAQQRKAVEFLMAWIERNMR